MSEDEVFQAVRGLVTAGEYLNRILGVPMPKTGGGGAFKVTPDGQYRRIYFRGTDEYSQAKAEGLVEPLPDVLVPASEEMVGQAERDFGMPFPPLLRRLYLEIGNGEFGPGYGLFELPRDPERDSAGWAQFPPSLLPVCTWGCGIYSFVDCSSRDGQMWGFDPNPGPDGVDALFPQPFDLAGWLSCWVENTLDQPCLIKDRTTGEWRGATEDDYANGFADADWGA